jgi:hypothetical protein
MRVIDAVVAVFEAHIGGVDLWGSGQCSIKKVPALLCSKECRIGGCCRRNEPERTGYRLDEVVRALDARLIGLCDVLAQGRNDGNGIRVVIVEQYEDQDGNAETDKQDRHDGA